MVAACLDLPQQGDESARLPDGMDWHRVCELALAHRVEGLVCRRLLREPTTIPAELMAALQRARQQQAFDFLAKAATTLKLVELLESNGHPTIVLKGCAVAYGYYAPEPELKYSGDVDILVAPNSFDAADQLLQRHGYVREAPEPGLPPRSASMARHLVNSYEYIDPTGGPRVELHHRLLSDPHVLAIPFADLLVRTRQIGIGAGMIRSLGPADLLTYLCCHGAGHAYARLKWLGDIAHVLRVTDDPASEQALELARTHRCERSLALTFAVLERLAGMSRPAAASHMPPVGESLVSGVLRAISTGMRERPLGLLDMRDQMRALRYQLALAETWRSKRFMMLKHLVHLDDTSLLGLGVRWRPLYALLGRPLALARYVRRSVLGNRQDAGGV